LLTYASEGHSESRIWNTLEHSATWLLQNSNKFCEDERDDYQEDAKLDNKEAYDRVDQSEIDELLAEPGVDTNQEANPTIRDEPEQAKAAVMPGVQDEPIVSDEGSEQSKDTTRRSARTRTAPERLTYSHTRPRSKSL
jgi:hypothetical protein